MNVRTLLADLSPDLRPDAEGYTAILVTPRFPASRHVVLLAVPRGESRPRLVVKVPRLAHDSEGIEREHAVLVALERSAAGTRDSVPRVVSFGEVGDRSVLVESYVDGVPLGRDRVLSDTRGALEAALTWLLELPLTEDVPGDRFSRLVERPLTRFGSAFGGDEADLVQRTLELVEPLRDAPLPSVVEHGDLSHPNLLTLPDGGLGVLDWELGEVEGYPTHDLFFLLNYLATARADAATSDEHVRALHDALVDPTGWARGAVATYAERMGVERRLLGPLLVACWGRYTAGLVDRLHGAETGSPSAAFVRWLRTDRHYALWRHTLEHAAESTC